MRSSIVALVAAILLTACATTGPAPQSNVPPTADTPKAEIIPEAIQGRWGLVPADCEPGRSDAKGLLVIGEKKMRFYEATATLGEIDATHLRASFDFTGEGMTWQRDMALDVQDNGQTLIRREYGKDAAPGAFKYGRCST
ncbi:hypothetical protein [uncultured Salinisphaera sp.]|uniref:hypothetical protein n=1 Tax=uncultured Salinisphaera sp. TaxID=359372 RepID=UPI0032B30E6B